MKYKVIFSDIDGTLLDSNHKISQGTKDAVNRAGKEGIPFILVSARMPKGIIPLQKELGINSPIICFSGGLILGSEKENGSRDVLMNTYMDISDVKNIFNLVNEHFKDISFSIYEKDEWFADNFDNPWIKLEGEITNSSPSIIDFNSLLKYQQLEANKILCIGDSDRIDELNTHLFQTFPYLTINKSKPTYLEIMPGEVLKSSAIRVLEKILNVDQKEIIAIGDNYNDMDMISYAGMGIAMGNSPEEVKAVANDITENNDEDGVKIALNKYLDFL